MKKRFVLFLITLSFSACGSKYFLKPNEYQDWNCSKNQTYSSSSALKKVLANSYDLYAGYQLQRLLIQQVTSPDYKEARIELFYTNDTNGARNLYRRYQTFSKLSIGEEGSQSPGFVAFYRQNCFVRITAKRNLTGKDIHLVELAKLIDAKLMK